MAPAEALIDGEALMEGEAAMLEADGAAAGADELEEPVVDPPQAVRLSMATAAMPETASVVRLMVCIVNLLSSADVVRATDGFSGAAFISTGGHRPLVGVSQKIRGVGPRGWVGLQKYF